MSVVTLEVPKYVYTYKGNKYLFRHVNIMVDGDSGITEQTFNQDKHSFLISQSEIEKMENCISVGLFDLAGVEYEGN